MNAVKVSLKRYSRRARWRKIFAFFDGFPVAEGTALASLGTLIADTRSFDLNAATEHLGSMNRDYPYAKALSIKRPS